MLKFLHNDLFSLLVTVGIMLITARLFAEIGKKFKLPVVMGEILAGVILGPTVLGTINPDIFSFLFPKEGAAKIALDGITSISVIMLLFVAGLEVQLQLVLKQGKTAIYTSVTSMIIPFVLGFCTVWFIPQWFSYEDNHRLVYALFFGIVVAAAVK